MDQQHTLTLVLIGLLVVIVMIRIASSWHRGVSPVMVPTCNGQVVETFAPISDDTRHVIDDRRAPHSAQTTQPKRTVRKPRQRRRHVYSAPPAITAPPTTRRPDTDTSADDTEFTDNIDKLLADKLTCSTSCCTPQWPVPHMPPRAKTYDKYVPSGLTCGNGPDGSGCVCLTKTAADVIGARGVVP